MMMPFQWQPMTGRLISNHCLVEKLSTKDAMHQLSNRHCGTCVARNTLIQCIHTLFGTLGRWFVGSQRHIHRFKYTVRNQQAFICRTTTIQYFYRFSVCCLFDTFGRTIGKLVIACAYRTSTMQCNSPERQCKNHISKCLATAKRNTNEMAMKYL